MESGWIKTAERYLGFIALPNLSLYLIVLQIFGFALLTVEPTQATFLWLVPDLVVAGEWWRVFTFIAVPLADGFWIIFVIFFLYFIVNTLENEWGEFKTTFYLAISVVLTILYSFLTGLVVNSFLAIEMTLFFAVATLYPNREILLLIFPVKMKYMAIIGAAMLVLSALQNGWIARGYLLVSMSNYLLFFGSSFWQEIQSGRRRKKFKEKLK